MKKFTHSLILFLLAIVLISCSQKSSESTGSGGKRIYKFNLSAEPSNLNPISSNDAYASAIQGYIMEPLLTLDSETYEWIPQLAERYEISDDGMTFTYYLRKGVKWHDGVEFKAQDVKTAFDAYFDNTYNALNARPYLTLINSPEIIDDYTIKFTAKEKYFGNFQYINGIVLPVPTHIYGDAKKGSKITFEITGTGPFKLKEFKRGQKLILERNKDWWGWKEDYFKKYYGYDEIHALFIKEDAIAMEHFKKGEIHYLPMTPEDYVKRATGDKWGKELLKIKTENLAPKGRSMIVWNLTNPIFKDRETRVALAHLFNRELINEKFKFDMDSLSAGPWDSMSDYADKSIEPLEFNPKKASEFLKAAGWQDADSNGILEKTINGKKTELSFTLNNANKDSMKYFTIYKEDAKKAGVDIKLNLVDWNTMVKLFDEKKFDAVAMGWSGGSIDFDPKQLWHCESSANGGSNLATYCNDKVDALIEKGRRILDRDERIKVYQEIFRQIAYDQPNLFMFNPQYVLYGASKDLIRPKDTLKYGLGSEFWSLPE